MEKYLIHSNELHLIDAGKIHQAVEKMVESLDLAAGSTSNFDLWESKKTDMNLQKTSASNKKEIFQSHQTICSYKTRESHRSETLSF